MYAYFRAFNKVRKVRVRPSAFKAAGNITLLHILVMYFIKP